MKTNKTTNEGGTNIFRKALTALMTLSIAVSMAITSFAATEDYVVLQASDMTSLIDAAKANISTVIPVGIGLMAISFGIGYALSTLKKFKRG